MCNYFEPAHIGMMYWFPPSCGKLYYVVYQCLHYKLKEETAVYSLHLALYFIST